MSSEINEQLSKVISEFNIVTFKLQTLSDSFEKLIDKVEDMTAKISETKERQLLDRQSIEALQNETKSLDAQLGRIDRELVKVRISMAEKLAWGSVGGGLAAGIIKVIEVALGG